MESPALSEVARIAGVSVRTVVRVINHSPLINADLHERVRAAIAQARFVPDAQMRRVALRRDAMVALVHDGPFDQALFEAQAGAILALEGSTHLPVLHRLDGAARNSLRQFGDFLDRHRPAGVILLPSLAASDALAGMAWEYGCRCQRLSPMATGDRPDQIVWNEREATARAVHALAALGHTRIALIAGDEADEQMRQRELGYIDALADLGLDRGPSLIATGDGGFASGAQAAALLLDISPAPGAIIACSDDMAAGAIATARARDVPVPEGLSVVGFGDTPLAARLYPPLSSVRLPLFEAAHEAALRIVGERAPADAPLALPAGLVERATVAGPALAHAA